MKAPQHAVPGVEVCGERDRADVLVSIVDGTSLMGLFYVDCVVGEKGASLSLEGCNIKALRHRKMYKRIIVRS